MSHQTKTADQISNGKSGARAFAEQLATSARARAVGARDVVTEKIDGVAGRAADATTDAGERAGEFVSARGASLASLIKKHPIMLGAGVIVGAYLLMRLIRR